MLVRRPASVIGPLGNREQIGGGDVDVLAQPVDLVRVRHVLVEDLHGDRHQARMRDPGAVVAVAVTSRTLSARTFSSAACVGLGIVLDRESAPPCRPSRERRGGGRS